MQEQLVTGSPRRVGFVFWLAWVVANVVGFGALATADWATGGAVRRAGVYTFGLFGLLPSGLNGLVTGVIVGATVGFLQALVLGWGFSRNALWALATAVGMPAAFAMGAGALSFLMGVVLGIVQISALQGRFPRPMLWVAANSLGYVAGYIEGNRTGVAWAAHHGEYAGAMVGYTVGGGVVGVITGIALVWLLRLPHRPPSERPALNITRSMVDGRGLLRYWPVLFVSFLAWIIAEGVVSPLTRVEAPHAEGAALIVAGLLLLLALAAFVADTAAGLVAPASGVSSGRLPALMLVLPPVMLVLGLPFHLIYQLRSLSVSCTTYPFSNNSHPNCLLLPLGPLVVFALIYLAVRMALASAAVVIGGTAVHKAFMASWQLTKEQWGRLLLPGSPAVALWSAVAFIPIQRPMSWLTIVHGVLGGVASAWLAIVLTLAYIQLGGVQSGPARPARSIHKTVILSMLVCTVIGAGLNIGRHGLIPSGPGRIAFASMRYGISQIYVMNADGSNVMRLTNSPGIAWSPRFSPDGRKIVFFSARGGRTHVAMIKADGSGETRVTIVPGYPEGLEFALGGSKIAFISENNRGTPEIYLMNTDGSNVSHLANLPPSSYFATISPDGRRIVGAFIVVNDQIYTMNMNGSNVVNLNEHGFAPAFRPDGSKIVFESTDDHLIYVMNADGSSPSRLTNLPGNSPAFSPDGRKIVFTSPAYGPRQIYIMNADGSDVTRLTARWDNGDPTVSP